MTTHRERIQACLRGEVIDRTPVAFGAISQWTTRRPTLSAAAHLAFQRTYDFDLVKVTPGLVLFGQGLGR